MIISIQTENLSLLKVALDSNCDTVRFGSEFCELKIPRLKLLKKAYKLTTDRGKELDFVTPRLSDSGLQMIKEHLDFLNGNGEVNVIFNDLGLLNLLHRYSNLKPHMGRQLVYVPARCPWPEISVGDYFSRWMSRRRLAKIFYQTSLNYGPTIQFFQKYGVKNVDVDWIPKCFPHYNYMIENGLNLSLHLYLVPVTLTRKCHMARLLGEKKPEECSKPCKTQAFVLRHNELGIKLFLWGNVVLKMIEPSKRGFKMISRIGVSELVTPLNPVIKVGNLRGNFYGLKV